MRVNPQPNINAEIHHLNHRVVSQYNAYNRNTRLFPISSLNTNYVKHVTYLNGSVSFNALQSYLSNSTWRYRSFNPIYVSFSTLQLDSKRRSI